MLLSGASKTFSISGRSAIGTGQSGDESQECSKRYGGEIKGEVSSPSVREDFTVLSTVASRGDSLLK